MGINVGSKTQINIGGSHQSQIPAPGVGQPSQPVGSQPISTPPMSNSLVSLRKGERISLRKAAIDTGIQNLSNIKIGLGWDVSATGQAFDLDVFVFATAADGKCRGAQDFIFFNNPSPVGLGIRHGGDNYTGAGEGDDEVIEVDLNIVPGEIEKINIAITIHDGIARCQTFGMVQNAFARLVDRNSNCEFARFNLTDQYQSETAVVVGELYRHKDEWKFSANGSGFNDGLVALCKNFGIDATL